MNDEFEVPFKPVSRAARLLRVLRNWFVLLFSLALLIECFGTPHILTTYDYKALSGAVTAGNYLGITGWRRIEAGTYAPGCPPVLLVPLDEHIWVYVWHGIEEIF